ncbi:G protein-coupled glucose receptor regulating Gpa2 domain containing protein [Naviculisporaceae sp. PSN 640]
MGNRAATGFRNNLYDSEDASGSITPLPSVLSSGLVAVATFGFLSFLSSLWLLSYLTYRFVVWHVRPSHPAPKRPISPEPESPTTSDVNGFLVPAAALCPLKDEDNDERSSTMPKMSLFERLQKNPPNQFLILIYNLLFADIQQAMAFLLNITWISNNSLDIKNAACWAQGWFISTGDLASSVFITAIAVHTYLGVVKNYRLPTWIFYSAIACCWSFTYGLGILGVIITDNGSRVGGLYVRAGAWCWINSAFQDLRLYLHYLWIFISLALTTVVYIIIYFHLQDTANTAPHAVLNPVGYTAPSSTTILRPNIPSSILQVLPRSSISIASSSSLSSSTAKQLPEAPLSARHPTFLLYPLIYVLCTAPLAAGRIASMAGNNVPLSYFCFAGSMIASAGWLDVALYASTRRAIVFHSGEAPPSEDTGIETFAFMRTPPDRKFGNVVYARLRYLAGGGSGKTSVNGSLETVRSGPMGFGMDRGEVVGMAIQCETTTSVVVEEVPLSGQAAVLAQAQTGQQKRQRLHVDGGGGSSSERMTAEKQSEGSITSD